MPLYEYRCLDCKKRSTHLVLSLANQAPAACTHCASERVERILSRFASPKSEEARLEALADPSNLAGLDENDPQSMTRFMKKWAKRWVRISVTTSLKQWNQRGQALWNRTALTGCDRHCHTFSLDRSLKFPYPGNSIRALVRHMYPYQTRFCNGQRAQERVDDGGGDLPLSQDHPAHALSLSTESPDSRLQAWKRMALRTLGSGTVDSRSHQNHVSVVKDRLQ